MAVENPVSSQYVERYYSKRQSMVEIAQEFNVSTRVVRKTVSSWNPDLYNNEKQLRSEEKKKDRNEHKRNAARLKRAAINGTKQKTAKPKQIIEEQPGLCRGLDYRFETQQEITEWLDWHFRFSGLFPFCKKKGSSDTDLVQFAMSQSGVQNLLDGTDWDGNKLDYKVTKDVRCMISAARNAIPYVIGDVEGLTDGDLMNLGCSKAGKQGGRSDNAARLSMMK